MRPPHPQVEPNAANNKASVAAAPAAVTLVYVNGVAPGWREAGQGCKKCNASDVDAVREGRGQDDHRVRTARTTHPRAHACVALACACL